MSDHDRERAVVELLNDLSFAAALKVAPPGVIGAVAESLKPLATKAVLKETVRRFASLLAHQAQGKFAGGDGDRQQEYEVVDGRLCRSEVADDGTVRRTPLANFTARIVEQVIIDTGAGEERRFRVEGALADGTALPRIDVPATEFSSMDWPEARWGARAAPVAGRGRRDQLREGIQLLSRPVERQVYGHLGWRKVAGQWVYLHAGGAVGASEIEVSLSAPLDRFRLPEAVEDTRGAASLSLDLLRCGPLDIAAPLLGAVYLAPLASVAGVDLTIFLQGASGSLKSVLSALALAHWGAFDWRSLPGNWECTANAVEKLLYLAKDALFVVDDYAPKSGDHAQRKMEETAQRVLRAQGNRSGRARMTRTTELRPDYPPRGLLLTSGEDLPPGASILARVYVVEVRRERLDLEVITPLQSEAHRLPHAMRAYVEWLAPQLDELQEGCPAQLADLRARANADLGHARAPSNVAQLALGVRAGLRFASEVGAIDEAAADRLEAECWDALLDGARRQATIQHETDPAVTFVEALRTLLAQGRISLRRRPTSSRPRTLGGRYVDAVHIGWVDERHVYLLPGAAREEVAKSLRAMGVTFAWSARSLHDSLLRGGHVVPAPDGRPETQLRFGDLGRQRVLVMPLRVLGIEVDGSAVTGVTEAGATNGDTDSPVGTRGSGGVSPLSPHLGDRDTHHESEVIN